MRAAISPLDPAASARPDIQLNSGVRGKAELRFEASGGVTKLAHLYHRDPLRCLFPAVAREEIPTAVLVTTSGGLVGGDRLEIDIETGERARACVVGQAAEKAYRSLGADTRVEIALRAGRESWLEWLPQETILFDGARLRRRTVVSLTGDARLLAGEMLVFGRIAMGERLTGGLLRDAWEVRVDDRLVWADALHMEGGEIPAALAAPAGFAGARAWATMMYCGPDAGDFLGPLRDMIGEGEAGLRVGATSIGPVLLARWLGQDAATLRSHYGSTWAAFRNRVAGLREAMPALWHI